MFEGVIADQDAHIERKIMFPSPIETKHIRIHLMEYHKMVDFKINLLGATAKEIYQINPILDERKVTYGKVKFMNVSPHQKR